MGGERPDCTDPQKTDLLLRVIMDYLLDGADRSAVRDEDLLRIGIDYIEIRKLFCRRFDLVHKSLHQCRVEAGICCARVPPLVMGEPGYMRPEPIPELRKPGNEA